MFQGFLDQGSKVHGSSDSGPAFRDSEFQGVGFGVNLVQTSGFMGAGSRVEGAGFRVQG